MFFLILQFSTAKGIEKWLTTCFIAFYEDYAIFTSLMKWSYLFPRHHSVLWDMWSYPVGQSLLSYVFGQKRQDLRKNFPESIPKTDHPKESSMVKVSFLLRTVNAVFKIIWLRSSYTSICQIRHERYSMCSWHMPRLRSNIAPTRSAFAVLHKMSYVSSS